MNINVNEIKAWLRSTNCSDADGVLAYIGQLETIVNDQTWISLNEDLINKIKAYRSLIIKSLVDLKENNMNAAKETLELTLKDMEKIQ